MNSRLLLFALLLVFSGFALGFYPISVLGVILLLPAALVPSRPQSKPSPANSSQAQRRTAAAVPLHASPPEPAPMPTMAGQPAAQPATILPPSSVPLFPATMFPSLSLSAQAVPAAVEPKQVESRQVPQRDELIEYGLILAVLKLVVG